MRQQTLLLRQVHPSWIREGRVTSQAFKPTPKDAHRLSVSDGDQVSPQVSWEQHTKRGLASQGVLAVTVSECETSGLEVSSDPLPDQPDHAIINFGTMVSNNQIEKVSKRLVSLAANRGWLYPSFFNGPVNV